MELATKVKSHAAALASPRSLPPTSQLTRGWHASQLLNLYGKLGQVRSAVTRGIVRALLAPSLLQRIETIAKAALGVLADVAAASAAGRWEMAEDEETPRTLVEAMACHESVGCQVHGGGGRALRWKMRQLGAVQALHEVCCCSAAPSCTAGRPRSCNGSKTTGKDGIKAHSCPRMKAAPSTACHGNDGDKTKACRSARGQDSEAEPEHEHEVHHVVIYGVSVDMTNTKQLLGRHGCSEAMSFTHMLMAVGCRYIMQAARGNTYI
uniref:Uncharacterized protein n=1 Tax=Aegilops tauschii TaxID=37682 RepID=M8C268_AEGTA